MVEQEHKCEKCKKKFKTKSRYQRFCDNCYEEHDKLKQDKNGKR